LAEIINLQAMELANRIRKIREVTKLTQAEVAYKIDISPSAYGQIERRANNASFETLKKIACVLNVSIAFLVDINSSEFIEKNKL
jgi:transcriptional regulator with XRE-family HTH domain